MRQLVDVWYQKKLHPLSYLLLPFSHIFQSITFLRRQLYRKKIFKTYRANLPVIVVGNITTGGTGKTPFVIWLAQFLKAQGFTPGIVTRGVGGKKHHLPHRINAHDLAEVVGDEAVLIHRRTQCPVVICLSRVKAIQKLKAETNCNIIISDDGLQHYAMARDIEIVMVDDHRQFGNKRLLPAGPLREKIERLNEVNFIIIKNSNGINANVNDLCINENKLTKIYEMKLSDHQFIALQAEKNIAAHDLPKRIHAVAGIGNPQTFFEVLSQKGFDVIPHVFKDHAIFSASDFNFNDDLAIVMTEKDAVKCFHFADHRYYFLEVSAKMNKAFEDDFLNQLKKIAKF